MAKKYKKSPASVMKQRTEIIMKLRLAYFTEADICQYVSDNLDWKVCERTIYRYIRKADNLIEQIKIPEREEWLRKAGQLLGQLLKEAYAEGNKTECRKLLETANKIHGFEKMALEIPVTEITINRIPAKEE